MSLPIPRYIKSDRIENQPAENIMINNCLMLKKTQILDPRKAKSGDVIKISIKLIGTGPLNDPTTKIKISCNFWVKVIDKPPDKQWKKIHGGFLAPVFSVTFDNSGHNCLWHGIFIKKNKEIRFNNNNELMDYIDKAMSVVADALTM